MGSLGASGGVLAEIPKAGGSGKGWPAASLVAAAACDMTPAEAALAASRPDALRKLRRDGRRSVAAGTPALEGGDFGSASFVVSSLCVNYFARQRSGLTAF